LCIGYIFAHIFYSVYFYTASSSDYVAVNLSSSYRNIKFTSDTIYFLNGVAYDFYSIDEVNSHSGARSQWKTFPFPNEYLPVNITPWLPPRHLRNESKSVNMINSSVTTTGLAFVDRIYIVTHSRLTDRHANLKRMLDQYKITNCKWRMKWTYAKCRSSNKRKEIYRKLNLEEGGK